MDCNDLIQVERMAQEGKEPVEEETEAMEYSEDTMTEAEEKLLESFKKTSIACESFNDAVKDLSSTGWIEGVINDLVTLKRLTDGETVFKFSYENFCKRYYNGRKFSSTGNSVRTAIAKRFSLDNKQAKAIVPYLNDKLTEAEKANGDKFKGKLAIDYMNLEL